MEKKINIKTNSLMYFLSISIPKVIMFLIIPIYTRIIIPEEYAIYTFSISLLAFITVFSTLGLPTFYLRQYSFSKDKKDLNGSIYWGMIIWNFILISFLIFIGFMFWSYITNSIEFFPYIFIALITHFFHVLEIIPIRTYRIKGEVKKYLVRSVLKTILTALFSLFFILVLKLGVIGLFYSNLIVGILFGFIFLNYMRINSYLKVNKEIFRTALKFSKYIFTSDIISKFSPLLINLIIIYYIDLSSMGIYSIAVSLTSVLTVITSTLLLTVEPIIYNSAQKKDFPIILANIKKGVFLITIIFSLGYSLIVKEFSQIFLGESYHNAWIMVQPLIIANLVMIYKNFYLQVIIIQLKTNKVVIANLVNLIVNIVVLISLIPILGYQALGWSNIIAYFASFIVLYTFINKTNFKEMHTYRDIFSIIILIVIIFIDRFLINFSIFTNITIKLIILLVFIMFLQMTYKINFIKFLKDFIFRKDDKIIVNKM